MEVPISHAGLEEQKLHFLSPPPPPPPPSHTPPYRVALEAGERELRVVHWRRHVGEVNSGYRNRISGLRDR